MSYVLVRDGGIETPRIFEKLLRLRKAALILAFTAAYFYAQFAFATENMEITRISEHALMPGLVTSKFDKAGLASKLTRELDNLPKSKSQQEFICENFLRWGLSCYEQKWRTNIAAFKTSGTNVYGWVRAGRADGTEAQLIAVQLGARRTSAIAHVMAFANFAKDQVYWARDIVFVFVENAVGMAAFLDKYHNFANNSAIIADDLNEQSGLLIAGVAYEASRVAIKNRKIATAKMNGVNGLQANLDLFNGIAKILHSRHQTYAALYDYLPDYRHSTANPYLVPLRAIYTQAFIEIEGIHSVMGLYGVQGVTIGIPVEFSEAQAGQLIEAVARMLNNALERLHQSYFMYILADDIHFASIAYYMPIIGLLGAPLLLNAYYEWRQLSTLAIPTHFLLLHCYGFGIYAITTWIYTKIGDEFGVRFAWPPVNPPAGSESFSLTHAFLIVSSMPVGLVFANRQPEYVSSLRLLCQLETALALGCVSLINFGLAAICALFAVPIVTLMTFEAASKFRAYFRTLALVLANPMTIITYLAMNMGPIFEYAENWKSSELEMAEKLAARMLRENALFGSHHIILLCFIVVPIWNCLFSCALNFADEPGLEAKTKKDQ
ncbi:unnamed protein product [Caenorhabditis bovis]|uniref:Uncharacterized protein n=1 Tax=Caenorhabditis bovis TaxID=2654633 RepID=A0A8S1F931_9PELO|nr:unnamed protein product [Caenorhabditis bovis]